MSRPHLLDALRDRVLLADGGLGSFIQASDLTIEGDFMGQENCSEILTLSRPDFVRDFHTRFFAHIFGDDQFRVGRDLMIGQRLFVTT